MCALCARPVKLTGLVQGANAPPSSEQVNVTGDSLSVKVIEAEVEDTLPLGPTTDGTGGATVSTVQARLLAVARFPAAST